MKITVYSKSGDPYSDMLKNILKSNNVEFENIEVSKNKENFKKMQEISGQNSTPVLVIDEKAYVGFDRELIKRVLGIDINKKE